jgi:hypothetical protein
VHSGRETERRREREGERFFGFFVHRERDVKRESSSVSVMTVHRERERKSVCVYMRRK